MLSFKLYKRETICIVASKVVAFCAFVESSRIYLEGGVNFDVEDSLEDIRKELEYATSV